MNHIQNYNEYNLVKETTQFDDTFNMLIEKYSIKDIDKLDEALTLLNEALIKEGFTAKAFRTLLGKVFPKDLSMEEYVIHYAQYVSLISSLAPGIGSTLSLGIEVGLLLYWMYKYSSATDQASRDEATSELIIGVIITGLTAIGTPAGRLLKGPFKMLFKGSTKQAQAALKSLGPKELRALQTVAPKIIPVVNKGEKIVYKGLSKLEKFLPSGFSNSVKKMFSRFKSNAKVLSKKSIKQSDEAIEAAIKSGNNALDLLLKQNKNLDANSVKMLMSRLKAGKHTQKYMDDIYKKLAKDETGGLKVFDDIFNSPEFAKNGSNIFDKKLLSNYKIYYNKKQMSFGKASKQLQKDMKLIPKNQLDSSKGYLTIKNGVAEKSLGKKLKSGTLFVMTLPYKLAKFGTEVIIKSLTFLNRQIVYVVDEKMTDINILTSIQKGLDATPILNTSKKYLEKHPELVIIKYNESGVRYFHMDYKTKKRGKETDHAEFIGSKMFLDSVNKAHEFSEYDIPKSDDGYIDYYTIVSSDVTPELTSIVMFAVEVVDNTKKLYAVNINTKSKVFELTPLIGYEKVVSASIITYANASQITQDNYDIVQDRIKDYEEEERPEQKRLGGLLGLDRMDDANRKKYRTLFMRDIDDIQKIKKYNAEDKARNQQQAS